MKKFALIVAAAAFLAMPLSAQLITLGTGTNQNTVYTEPAPYGNYWWGSRHQFVIQAAELSAQGIGPGANLNSVAFDVFTVNGAPLTNFEIKGALTTSPDLSIGWIAGTTSILAPIPSYAATAGWNTHILSTPILWDGTSNIVLETCFNNGSYTFNCVFNQTIGTFISSRWYRQDATGICVNPATTGTGTMRPNMQLGFSGTALPPEYQVNQPVSSLDINGATGTSFTHNPATMCAGSLVNANIGTSTPGMPWEIALSFGAVLPASAGGIPLPGGQVFNLDFFTAVWLNGGAAPSLLPIPGSFTIPFTAPSAPFGFAAQQLVADPTNAIGIALSQPASMSVIGAASQTLSLTDDSNVTVAFGAAPLCTPATLPLYGTAYTQVNVLSNGRLVFGTANNTWTPSLALTLTDAPAFGVWCDLNPGAGGTVTASAIAGGGFRVDHAAVPYFGTAIPNTFGLQIDSAGQAIIDGLGGIAVGGGQQWIGISGGNVTVATNGTTTAYAPASLVLTAGPATPQPTIYNMGTAGSLTTGLTAIMFVPNLGGNYDWVSF